MGKRAEGVTTAGKIPWLAKNRADNSQRGAMYGSGFTPILHAESPIVFSFWTVRDNVVMSL